MISNIENLHIELINSCFAKCAFCPRQLLLRKKDYIKQQSISLDFFKTKVDFKKLNGSMVFCGSLGEPSCYDDLLNLLLYIRMKNNQIKIQVHTNGSFRDESWWRTLANRLKYNPQNQVTFAIDGIGETHSIYRQGTSFNKICKNLKAFTDEGGNAYIKFLLFEHNKHQIKEIKQLALSTHCNVGIHSSFFYNDTYKKPTNQTFTKEEKSITNPKKPICDLLDYKMAFLGSDQKFYPCCYIYNRAIEIESTVKFNYNGQMGFDSIEELMDSSLISFLKENKDSLPLCKARCSYKYMEGVVRLV